MLGAIQWDRRRSCISGFHSLKITSAVEHLNHGRKNFMPRLRPLNSGTLKQISEDIETAIHSVLIARSTISSHFRKTNPIRVEWELVVNGMLKLRRSIPSEIKKRISN